MMRQFFIVISFLSLFGCSCSTSRTTATTPTDSIAEEDYDLGGKTYIMPEGMELNSQGGVFMNGTLVGSHTRITSAEKPLFKDVKIKGEWDVPQVSTSLFKDLDYINSLIDVLALTSAEIQNVVLIETGDYQVSTRSFKAALSVLSNTEVIVEGHISLVPNNYKGCYVMEVKDAENVIIHGKGSIDGDRQHHSGDSGEWGHGIYVINSRNVRISGLSISDCWGDCMYIGGGSSNITVCSCTLSRGRRQGISITSGIDIKIKDCIINDVQGTRPQFAIDIEPNKGEMLDRVVIENVKAINCYGGFKSWGGAEGAHIGTVTLRKCSVFGAKAENPVKFVHGDEVVIEGCYFDTDDKPGIFTDVVKIVRVRDNVIRSTHRNPVRVSRVKAKTVENNSQINR